MNMKLKGCSAPQIHLVGAFLAVATVLLSGYSVFSSWESRKSGIESTQLELTQVTTKLSDAQRDRGRLVNQISNLQSIVDEQEFTPQATSINELAIRVVALAEEFGIELEQFDPGVATTINEDSVMPISLRLTAPYNTLISWIHEIHQVMPDIHVVGISISSQTSTTTSVGSDIRLNWYIPADPDSAL